MKACLYLTKVQFDFLGPTFIHPESDIKSRTSINSREHLRTVVYLALYEYNTDMCLTVYLLVCVNEVLFTICACA